MNCSGSGYPHSGSEIPAKLSTKTPSSGFGEPCVYGGMRKSIYIECISDRSDANGGIPIFVHEEVLIAVLRNFAGIRFATEWHSRGNTPARSKPHVITHISRPVSRSCYRTQSPKCQHTKQRPSRMAIATGGYCPAALVDRPFIILSPTWQYLALGSGCHLTTPRENLSQ